MTQKHYNSTNCAKDIKIKSITIIHQQKYVLEMT